MKTYIQFVLLWLIVVGVDFRAANAAVQKALNKDKEWKVVKLHYHKHWTYAYDDGRLTDNQTRHYNYDFQQPGSYFRDDCFGDSFDDDYYYGWADVQWNKNLIATVKSDINRGPRNNVCGVRNAVTPAPDQFPNFPSEYCNASDARFFVDGFGAYYETVTRDVLTLYELRTGGKGLPGTRNLFVGSCPVTGIHNHFYYEIDNWPFPYDIPNTMVRLGDLGMLDSQGLVYKSLPDQVTKDVTPYVKEREHFGYEVPVITRIRLTNECVSPIPANKARTTIGVGEEVSLYFDGTIANVTPPTWTTTGGALSQPTGWNTLFTAPDNEGNVNVTCNVHGEKFEIPFDVLKPNGVKSTQRGLESFPVGQVGAGMYINVVLQPATVSFYRVEMMEPGADATGTTGYFINNAPSHNSGNGANDWHPVNNANKIVSPPENLFDHATSSGWPIGASGSYTWPISPIWRVLGNATTHPLPGWTDQVHTLGSDGTMRVDKLGLYVTRHP